MDKPVQQRELTLRSGFVLAGAALTYFNTVGFLNAFGVFQDYYTQTLLRNESQFQISWLGSFSTFTLFLAAPIGALLSNKFGVTVPVVIGAVLQVFTIFMISLCREYYQFFLAQGVLLGFSMSLTALPVSSLCPRYFDRNRGLASGITVAGSSLGGVIWPVVADQLLKTDRVSFPWTMRICGFIMIPIYIFVIFTARPPKKQLNPIVDSESVDSEACATEQVEKEQGGTEEAKKNKVDRSALRKPPFIFLCVGLFLMNLGFFAPFFFVTTYATNLDIAPSLAFYFSSMLNAASCFGRILPGWVADRIGRFNLLICSGISAGIVVFCWTTVTSTPGLVIWTLAYGFCSGAMLSMLLAASSSLVPPEAAATALGTVMGSVSLAGLFGPPIAGQLLEHSGYIAVASFAGAVILAGAVVVTFGRLAQSKKVLHKI